MLVASLVFYAQWGTRNLLLLVASTSLNFIVSCALSRIPDRFAKARRLIHLAGQLFNFGTLFWYKYRGGLGLLMGGHGEYSVLDAVIPIGISFYTFQQAIFLLDAFHRNPSVELFLGRLRSLPEKLAGFLRYAAFVLFFPHLVIGPIIYLEEFEPQVRAGVLGRLRVRDIEVGLVLIALGLFKKAVLADHLAVVSDLVFDTAATHGPLPTSGAWIGALSYFGQLYFDFSGYSDMALGSARLFGIRYPINFYSPLKAVSIVDFYRRWHITLTRAISRFLFTPLSLAGTRLAAQWRLPKGLARAAQLWIPLLLNFEVIALWHGARLTFALFGLLHGAWYVTEIAVRGSGWWKSWRRRTPDWLRAAIGHGIFVFLMLLAFALFRSRTVGDFQYLLSQMFQWQGTRAVPININLVHCAELLAACFAIIWFAPNSIEFLRRYRPGILVYRQIHEVAEWARLVWRPSWTWAVIMGCIFAIAYRFASAQAPFLYMGF